MACSGRRRTGKRALGHGAYGRGTPWGRRGATGKYRRARGRRSSSLLLLSPPPFPGSLWPEHTADARALPILPPGPMHTADARPLLILPPGCPEWGADDAFAELARGLLRAQARRRVCSVAKSVQAALRWHSLARALAARHLAIVLSTHLWHHANDYRRRRQHAGAAPLMWVHLRFPELMGKFWEVEIGVFPGEKVCSVQAYALGLLASDHRLIPAARAANWTCARMRRVCVRMQVHACVRALACVRTSGTCIMYMLRAPLVTCAEAGRRLLGATSLSSRATVTSSHCTRQTQ